MIYVEVGSVVQMVCFCGVGQNMIIIHVAGRIKTSRI